MRTFAEVIVKAKLYQPLLLSVAVAQDEDVLSAVWQGVKLGIVSPLLVGDEPEIRGMMYRIGFAADTPVVHEPDMLAAARKAVSFVKDGRAQIVMKGLVNSSDFLRAVLDTEIGLKTGRLLSHLSAFELPDSEKLVFHTDGGMNVAPSLTEKKDILLNGLWALKALGISCPKVALITANEQVSDKMPATVDARDLVLFSRQPGFPKAVVEGPIAFDVAVSPEAAKHKHIESEITGQVDLFLLPNIETGNVLGKVLVHYVKAKMAGVVLGATHPAVMTSRAESPEGKLNSIALACLIYHGMKERLVNSDWL